MKTLIITGALLLSASLLTAQEKPKQVTVRIKKVEIINGVETIKDTSYTTDESTALKADGHDIEIMTLDQAHGKRTVVINNSSSDGDAGQISIINSNDIDQDVEKALKEAGVEMDGKDPGAKRIVIVNKECSKDAVGKSEKKTSKVVVVKRVKIVEANSEDVKLLGKPNGVSDNKLPLDKMDFYPNPSNGKFNLKFDLKEKGETEISIMNIEGKKIYTEKLKNFSGAYDREIDISNNPKGVYFVKIDQGGHSQLKKIVLE